MCDSFSPSSFIVYFSSNIHWLENPPKIVSKFTLGPGVLISNECADVTTPSSHGTLEERCFNVIFCFFVFCYSPCAQTSISVLFHEKLCFR